MSETQFSAMFFQLVAIGFAAGGDRKGAAWMGIGALTMFVLHKIGIWIKRK